MGVFRVGGGEQVPAGVNRHRRQARTVDELVGLCRGLLADGNVNADEARFLAGWIERNRDVHDDQVVTALYQRVGDALADGVLNASEEADLLAAIHEYVGGEAAVGPVASESSRLPLDDPPPPLVFRDRTFVLTGTFQFGPRRLVTAEIEQRGGWVDDTVRPGTILIVGAVASRDWLHSSYGRKIMKAMEYRAKGHETVIVGEDHWARFL